MLTVLLTIVHVIVAVILILVVLLQTGKRADLAGAFGGGGSQTVFGTRGAATFLSKLTTAAAVLFMITSLGLSLVSTKSSRGTDSVLPQDQPPGSSAPAPARPTDPSGTPALPAEATEPGEDSGSDQPSGGDDGPAE